MFTRKGKARTSGVFRYTDDHGKRHRELIGRFETAVVALHKRKCEIRDGKLNEPAVRKTSLTLEQVFELRIKSNQGELTDQTERHYRSLFKTPRFDALRDVPIRKICVEDIENILIGVHHDDCSKDTQKNYRALMSGIFSYAVKKGFAAASPVKKTKAPKPSKGRDRILAHDEERVMRDKLRKSWKEREPELDLFLNTGMRVGEAWHLTWDRVHPDRGIFEVPDEGKTGWRDIPMNSVCRKAIATLHEQSEGSRFVIPNPPGKMDEERTFEQMRYWARSIQKLANACSINGISAHSLRHTFASRLVMAGVDLRTVQEFLGHASIAQTMRYAHFSPERGQADIERLVAPTAPAAPEVRRIA